MRKEESIIEVEKLNKEFTSIKKYPGMRGIVKNFFMPQKHKVSAVKDVSFSVKKGELVGFIGPNGAGKSTTLKILTGIMYPTSGKVRVLGLEPQKDRGKLAYQLGTIFGQRQQLWYHLPPIDSYELFSAIYDIPKKDYEERLNRLVKLFGIEPYLHTPVKKLSLGERMRCEFVASLLHKPRVLFLDEPTIGLDIVAKRAMRDYIKKINETEETTIILTSHDLDDIEQLCSRIVVINKGTILYDGTIDKIKDKISVKRLTFFLDEEIKEIAQLKGVKIVSHEQYKVVIEVDKSKVPIKKVIDFFFSKYSIADVDIEDMPIEELIAQFYTQ